MTVRFAALKPFPFRLVERASIFGVTSSPPLYASQ
ncbi:hypothetical protein C7399_118150 [Paraburkholderia tropica]|uniref:Uncharacterized protein n=1 Tax=Paraburkholderia tropica TaxID=92647 RepID=A0ABX5MIZ4_9BURK|nr:hypothetical protein C7400_117152 [Paraburkholderia tropica]PZW76525.1 hypothetical protein C7399_118150 [Paraburkholderia tropica]